MIQVRIAHCILLCAFASLSVMGQQRVFTYRNFSFKDGLETTSIRAMTQDGAGFIWVGGGNGLSRYDGHRFETFQSPIDQEEAGINTFLIDILYDPFNDRLWLASLTDLQYLDLATYQFHRPTSLTSLPSTLAPAEHRSLMMRSEHQLWFASGGQLFELDLRDHVWRPLSPMLHLPETVNTQWLFLEEMTPQTACLIYKNAAVFIRLDTLHTDVQFAEPGEVFARGCYDPDRQRMFIAAHLRLVTIEWPSGKRNNKAFLYQTDKGIELPHLLNEVSFYDSTTLMLSGMSGHILYHTETDQFVHYPPEKGEYENNMSASRHFTDREGNIWRSSIRQFVNVLYFQNRHWLTIGPIKNKSAIHVEPYKTRQWTAHHLVFSGSGVNGIGILDRRDKSVRLYQNRFSIENQVYDFCVVSDSRLLTCDGNDLFEWHSPEMTVNHFRAIRDNTPVPIAATNLLAMDDHVLAYGHGTFWVIRLSDQQVVHQFDVVHLSGEPKTVMDADVNLLVYDNGKAIFSRGPALYAYDVSTKQVQVHTFPAPQGQHPTPPYVQDLEIDRIGQIWMASLTQGIYCYDPASGNLRQFKVQNSRLESNYISELTLDASDRIWVGTASGIYLFDVNSKEILTHLSDPQGVPDVGYDLHYHPGLDWITLNTYPNISILDMASFQDNLHLSPPVITSIIASGVALHTTPIQKDTQFSLKYQENDLQIAFTNLGQNNSDQNQYRYRMTGIDTHWIVTHEHFVNYSRLRPGTYQFQLQASNNEGRWHPDTLTLKFRIHPAFYATWWFVSLACLMVTSLIWIFYRMQLRQVRREEKIKRAYDKKLSEIEMKALRAQMNPHFIFNALNSIQKFIFEKDEYSASQYLTKFSRLIRLILDQSAQDFVSIHSENDLLTHYLDLEQLRFSHHFTYSIDVADNVHWDWMIPSMVIQPHVENAIWHGLMHKEDDGVLQIAFSTPSRDVLQVIIEDNGVGRREAAEQKSKQVLKKKSYGSSLSSDRLKSLYRWREKETSTRIDDLYRPDGTPAGTRVTITLPVMAAPEGSTAQ